MPTSTLSATWQVGVECENLEYLKGETHYLAATIRKKSLLRCGVLRADMPGSALLSPSNVDLDALRRLARQLALCIGIPHEAAFCEHHPVQLFDFSSRSRCAAPFRVLAVKGNAPTCFDLEVVKCLRDANTGYHDGEVAQQKVLVSEKAEAIGVAQKGVDEAAAAAAKERAAADGAPSAHAKQAARARLAEAEASVSARQKSVDELKNAHKEVEAKLRLRLDAQSQWRQAVNDARGASALCPVFPAGDALLEPFWPQGLGSNRGFHGACDAAWAMQVLAERGIESCLMERAFGYDVMLHATFTRGCVQPGSGWTADPLTRYAPAVIKGTLTAYQDPKSKKSHKGNAAVPERYWKLVGASLAAMGKGTNVAPGLY